jgi:hypothetical protein
MNIDGRVSTGQLVVPRRGDGWAWALRPPVDHRRRPPSAGTKAVRLTN